MCCSSDKTAKASEATSAALQTTLSADYSKTFAAQQAILGPMSIKLADMMNNPQGFDPKTLALMKTSASDQVAAATRNAQIGAGNYANSHGGADLGSGVQAQVAGGIEAQGAIARSQQMNNIDIQSGLLKNSNQQFAIQGLTNVAQAYNPTGYANAANSAGNTTANLSKAVLDSQQAGWSNTFGIIKGIAGLGVSAATMGMGAPITGMGGASSTTTGMQGNGIASGWSANSYADPGFNGT